MTAASGKLPGNGKERRERAVRWVVRFEALAEVQLSRDETAEWERFAADPDNLAAFDQFAALRQTLKALPDVPPLPDTAELQADCKQERLRHVNDDGFAGIAKPSRRLTSIIGASRLQLSSLAALFVLAVGALLFSATLLRHSPADRQEIHNWTTSVGEHKTFTLSDGSIVTLGARTTVLIDFNNSQRQVMLESGEALFRVARDAARPFKVLAGAGSVTALGTEFQILRAATKVVVTVTDGSVEVAPVDTGSAGFNAGAGESGSATMNNRRVIGPALWVPARVERGQQMTYEASGQASAVERSDAQTATAWMQGTLVYRRRPLSEVVEDVRRYTTREIALSANASQWLYSGTVSERNVDDWIRHLSGIFPVRIVEPDPGHISIQAQPGEAGMGSLK